MALLTYALCTVAEAEVGLGLSTGEGGSRLEALVNSATILAETYCRAPFVIRSFTELHPGWSKRIYLKHAPVTSVTSIVDPALNTVPSTDYIILGHMGVLEHFGRFPIPQNSQGQRAYWTVTFDAGLFANTAAVGADLKEACWRIAGKAWESPSGGAQSVGVGSLSVSYGGSGGAQTSGGNMPADAALILDGYRRNIL